MTATRTPPTVAGAPTAVTGEPSARALLWWETVRLLRHPFTLVGAAASLLWGVATVGSLELPFVADLVAVGRGLVAVVAPLAVGGFLAAHGAAGRPARTDMEELSSAAPATRTRRTAVGLVSTTILVVPAAVAVATHAVAVHRFAAGTAGTLPLDDVATALLLPTVAASAGVCLAVRRASRRSAVAGLAVLLVLRVVVAVLVPILASSYPSLQAVVGPFGDERAARLVLPDTSATVDFALLRPLPSWAMAVYVASLGALFTAGALALARSVQRHLAVLAVAGLAVVAAGAWLTRPPDVATFAPLLAASKSDDGDRVCVDGRLVTGCMLPEYADAVAYADGLVTDVLAPVPEAQRPGLRLDQYVTLDPTSFVDDVLFLLGGQGVVSRREVRGAVRLPDGTDDAVPFAIPLGFGPAHTIIGPGPGYRGPSQGEVLDLDWASQQVPLAGAVVGIRTGRPAGGVDASRQCTTAGQAREVVALWLAGRTLPGALLTEALAGRAPVVDVSGPAEDAPLRPRVGEVVHGGPAVLSAEGVELAGQLLTRPDEQVTDALAADWARWSDPSTPTTALVDELGLTAPRDVGWGSDLPAPSELPTCT